MNDKTKRLRLLEAARGPGAPMPYVWKLPGQSREDALAAAGLPADAPNPFFTWKESQWTGQCV